MENFEKLREILDNAQADAEKFFVKGNKSAGTRVRTAMQDLKNAAQEVRKEVSALKNQG